MKLLIQTLDVLTIPYAQAVLESEGIKSFVLDEHMRALQGSTPAFPRRLMVIDRDLFLARAIMRDHGIETVE